MKFIILLLSLNVFAGLESPRETMKQFLKSMVKIKENTNIELNYTEAYKTIAPSIDGNLSVSQKNICNELINVFDKMEKVDYEVIPKETIASKWVYDKRTFEGKSLEISLVKSDKGHWTFSNKTINSLDFYREYFKDKTIVEGVVKLRTYSTFIKSKLPKYFQKSFLSLEYWQWLLILTYILIAYILEKFAHIIFSFIINFNFPFFKNHDKDHLERIVRPLGKLAFFAILIHGLTYLDLKIRTYSFLSKALYVLSSVMLIWFGKKCIEIAAIYFKEKAITTDAKFDDIMVPLLAKTSYVVLYLLGALLVAYSVELDVTGIIAGLGIGGLAFAFAAKDTLANFFGSIMLVLDRPFDIGDVIVAGDIEGTVEEVGFRSTRIRTFYDSLITISNGNLVNRSIDNKGKRRYRRLTTTLGVEYDTTPKKIEAFCEGIRQIIIGHKWTRKDNFNVYFSNFGASSLDIGITVYWETSEFAREQSEKHRLMIDILRLAKEMNINFAFPTQTIHMFKGEKQVDYNKEEVEFLEGIEKAKKVASKPYSLKNPRSNFTQKDQFGDNDFGL